MRARWVSALGVGLLVVSACGSTSSSDSESATEESVTTATPTESSGPPATDPPATETPTTETPPTAAPVTEVPTTDAPPATPPPTEPPATDPPATDPPVTDPPATDPPHDPSLRDVLGEFVGGNGHGFCFEFVDGPPPQPIVRMAHVPVTRGFNEVCFDGFDVDAPIEVTAIADGISFTTVLEPGDGSVPTFFPDGSQFENGIYCEPDQGCRGRAIRDVPLTFLFEGPSTAVLADAVLEFPTTGVFNWSPPVPDGGSFTIEARQGASTWSETYVIESGSETDLITKAAVGVFVLCGSEPNQSVPIGAYTFDEAEAAWTIHAQVATASTDPYGCARFEIDSSTLTPGAEYCLGAPRTDECVGLPGHNVFTVG